MNEEKLRKVLRQSLQRVTEETGLVGGVVDVIRDGQIVFTEHYGYADRENRIPPDQDTLFDVASCSKAWTVMLAAKCVDEGLIDWDEPIYHAIPEFTMTDPYAGKHLSIRDMASHRSGLPGHDFMREKILGDRANLMRKTAFLEANTGFRNKYQYNNHMFILLGYLEEVLRGGMKWEDQIRQYIAEPLGIEPIRFRGEEADMTGIHPALPYCSDGYQAHRCGYSTNNYSAPCGGIRISMKNMAKWITAMCREGKTPDGGWLCSAEQYKQIITPVISAPEEDCFNLKNASYALGWLNADYLGHTVVFHSGGLEGFNTQVGFLPGEDCGYVMCFNTGTTPAHRIARAIVLDTLIFGEPQDSYEPMLADWLAQRDIMQQSVLENRNGKALTEADHPELVGSFTHPAYESFDIVSTAEGLEFQYGDFRALLREEVDGAITGYSGQLDGLTPAAIKLIPDGQDLRLITADSELKLLFKRQ
ncbi:MAG: beta-lactamase family protein [Firmicutes bacterium]|nr:beta-lactamase family protein [Bacillota bacterium]